ncbi:hypothetical protein KIF53_08210 [Chromobacterium subtsugae]|uniref:Uncharacterized protein n=1 Tax=Chromobacterium subtsugae TaxID=251747 RepID=A0ABS7FC09_9NEIS|nr:MULTISPECIES: hypothetical protein [Chromobacterium]KUM01807.1 hypothetical protein Cv017_06400 [Chromobacterium subtsugae]KZE86758.1 hypothetical protein AWB61_14790 [Chromobacterium sp. F49]MBW7568575.1 hypothetical protein [Chromobacterium subtsugae]MBW8287610.1 hypothetical protein [Chromobacterium subtsugae]WSE93561.1 hypothetical protein U6115_10095 [Chromobacterium subtsugae]
MVIDFQRARSLRLENKDDCHDAIVLLAGYFSPTEISNAEIECYKVSHADIALIRDAFKRAAPG